MKTSLIRTGSDGSSSIGDALCNHAASIKANMIVMTKTSKSALVKFFTGSVARYTVDHSAIPVLLCPTSNK